VEQEAALTAKDLGTSLEQFSSDLWMLSNAPPVQGLLRAQDHGGHDPATGRSYEEWIDGLQQLFLTTAQSKQFYRQLRYLDQTGEEIVWIEDRDGVITVVWNKERFGQTELRLESRASAVYFTAAQPVRRGEIAISPLMLSQEDGSAGPPVPIIYLSTPIIDRAGTFRGVVVSTVYAASFLNRLSVTQGQIYLADQDGFYLAHPDPQRTFGRERRTGYSVAADFPQPYATLNSSGQDAYTTLDAGRGEVVALQKLHFDPLRPEHYWLLIRTLPEEVVLGPVRSLGALVLGVALVVIILVALLALHLARGFTRPILQLTGVAEQLSQIDLPRLVDSLGRVAAGDVTAGFELSAQPVVVRSADEVGQLGRAFNKMTTSLREAHIRLSQTQEQLRMQKEAAEAANAAKSVFLANMSHELRTPLNGILGYAQILQQRVGPHSPLLDGLTTIQQSGEHLLALINDILDLSRVEAGKLELAPTDLHLPTFLGAIANLIRMRAESKDLRFAYETDPALPPVILADELRLRQVLLNLLGNAIKFTDHGQVTLRVTTTDHRLPTTERREDTETGSQGDIRDADLSFAPSPLLPILHPPIVSRRSSVVRFEVEDTGPGIPPDELARIFQPFEQGGDVERRAGGTGLGLAISRQLVRLMSGDIQVQSAVGQGSSFWFEIAVPVLDTLVRIPSTARSVTGYTGPRRAVLVVDDIAENRAVLVELLTALGFTVFEATNGQQGVAQAQDRRPDLILMDRAMPVLDGREATRRIRQMAALKDTPIIAVSASVAGPDRAQSLAAGASAFVPKPIHQDELLEQVGRLLQLEWLYDQPQQVPADTTVAQVGPPPDVAQQLYDLAREGLILEIRAQLDALEQRGLEYCVFVAELRQLARRYRTREIQALLEPYLMEGRRGR
jgi:signal transduction histidine kinase/DNA-binding NarL/FixJ family response regulator